MSEERVFGYVRHDLYDAVVAERDALREGNRELAMQVMASDEQAQEAYGETLRLRDKVEALTTALRHIDAMDPEERMIDSVCEQAAKGIVLRMGEVAREALKVIT